VGVGVAAGVVAMAEGVAAVTREWQPLPGVASVYAARWLGPSRMMWLRAVGLLMPNEPDSLALQQVPIETLVRRSER